MPCYKRQRFLPCCAGSTKTWRAYLSTQAEGQTPAVNARDRIGTGPWFNSKGVRIAANVTDLHGDLDRDRNFINKTSALDEKGNVVNGVGDTPNQHDILTGTQPDGRAFTDAADHTCGNWTSSNTAVATVGAATGDVTGITSGIADITYTMPTGCVATIAVTVNPNPPALTGPSIVCAGQTVTLGPPTLSGGAGVRA